MMNSSSTYLMDDPREANRLASKVDPAAWVQRYLSGHLSQAADVLDVGCGPGVIAAEIASQCPQTKVVGLDLSAQRFSELAQRNPTIGNLTLQEADAGAMPLPDNAFDLVYSRFLFEYLADRSRAIAEMVRVCRPGGRVLIQDLDGQLVWHFPEDAELQAGLERVLAGMAKKGFDPFVGRKLYSLAHRAGLVDIDVTAESYHLFVGKIDDHNLHLWELKLDIVMPAASKILGSESAAKNLTQRFLDYLQRDDTLTYSVVFTVVGRKSK